MVSLEKKLKSLDWRVRAQVASTGYLKETLRKDHDWRVREALANAGYCLAQLVNDKHDCVRNAAHYALTKETKR